MVTIVLQEHFAQILHVTTVNNMTETIILVHSTTGVETLGTRTWLRLNAVMIESLKVHYAVSDLTIVQINSSSTHVQLQSVQNTIIIVQTAMRTMNITITAAMKQSRKMNMVVAPDTNTVPTATFQTVMLTMEPEQPGRVTSVQISITVLKEKH